MPTIHMPNSQDRKQARRRRALGYLASGLLIITSIFLSYNSNWNYVVIVVEAWWIWAVMTDPGIK